jgi:hypothetical protein
MLNFKLATDRQNALDFYWGEFQQHNNIALHRDGIELPDSTAAYWAIMFADYVLEQGMERLDFSISMAREAKKNIDKPIPARVWFDENRGICPTCGMDLNPAGKVDIMAHFKGTCKQ